jgi:hypothetical protein
MPRCIVEDIFGVFADFEVPRVALAGLGEQVALAVVELVLMAEALLVLGLVLRVDLRVLPFWMFQDRN